MHYATSTMQAPKYAQPGQEAKELEVLLELKVIADVGWWDIQRGKVNFTFPGDQCHTQDCQYHFTTLTPNLALWI